MLEERALVNSQEEAKVPVAASFRAPGAARFPTGCKGANSVPWLGAHLPAGWREARLGISVVAIWAAEVVWAARAVRAA